MKIGVTGANGFVGQALCAYLMRMGHLPLAITRRALNQPDTPNRIIPNLTDEVALTNALQGCDVLVHLASRAHMPIEPAGNALIDYWQANVDIAIASARAAAASGVKRIIYMSSIKVNGERTHGQPFTVNSPPQPEDAYGISKYEAELALGQITQEFGLELVIIRSPLIYGKGAKGNLARLQDTISRGIPLPLASIRNKRDLISLPNICDLIATCVVHSKAPGQIFLAADGVPRNTSEIIQLLPIRAGRKPRLLPCPQSLLQLAGKLVGKKAQINRLIGDLEVDISHTCETLNWQLSTVCPQSSLPKQ